MVDGRRWRLMLLMNEKLRKTGGGMMLNVKIYIGRGIVSDGAFDDDSKCSRFVLLSNSKLVCRSIYSGRNSFTSSATVSRTTAAVLILKRKNRRTKRKFMLTKT